MQLALYINDNLTKPPEIIKNNLNNRLARNDMHGARNPNPANCQFARNFLATFFEVSQKRGCQVARINLPLCQTSFARQNRWQLGFLSKMNN